MVNDTMFARGAESSVIREIFSYGLERKAQIGADKVFDYSLGNPSVPAPAAVRASIERSLQLPSDQLHGYTPAPGLPEVRTAVAESLNRRFGTSYGMGDVFMTVGAAASVSMTIHALTNPGEEVIVIAPYFPEYAVWIEKAGATCVEVLADQGTFQVDAQAVAAAITPRTAAVIIDSPNNPTGAVYTRETLDALAAVLSAANADRDEPIYLISDEPYREIVYGVEVPWVPSIYENTVVCYSYSKSLSLPGERVGWVLVPNTCPNASRVMPAIAGAARTLGFVCAPALFQRVVADCVDEPSDVAAYARNREVLTQALSSYGYTYVEPDGAFYLWVKALEDDAEAFCERAKRYELLPVPSNSFGVPGWFRLGYCIDYDVIVNSLPAWKQLADDYRRER
ncbi:pyridoxal phosphate-dependent aminotransferase [Collinsella tanakaei]|uniref:Aminotransferase n=1 Tax=Collinsella ihumii TaxID=1720204 RepID=A0ABT7XFA5_9ACTN|nr:MULTISPECIES: pyridoxal phosphate-dependent aminotransferase [Collinsella]MBM6785152.1 pyridoxal phosphate-dependent aminotransferase [Collinsella tanakaei]MBM6904750.1 pyridoxal phosphate-dependent aminotransferase [Collinsella tanakaei]MCF6412552.1 pyridoxal phosphate-dependent aminotransferase [Collinsella tanakaei]MDN0063872.1 pyridoxal phosphate-dependent aminotransferase [Collinsella ihumii]OUO61197.1 aspartate aminotransferase [Collinsella sp. An271]